MNATKTDPDRTPVAQDIFTWCTKEKTETWHVVRNQGKDGIVDRVVCKACGSEHKYRRAAKTVTLTRAPGRNVIVRNPQAASGGISSDAIETTWFAGVKKWGTKPVNNFDPGISFSVGEVVEHAVFGKGVVQTRRENKIDVLFKDGIKTLPSKR
ncbi:MAG: hypothetical protein JST16_07810 [Bdellovibrionales bacterium]|nr:hypothetical protein [Bdellovibrionales bacterium]